MNRPEPKRLPDGDNGTWIAYLASEADAYMDALESELTRYRQAEAERAERVRAACDEVLPE